MKRWWLFLFFGLALAQGALDAREALRLALAQNPTYQNAREALQTAQLELEALRADPSTLILPLTQAEHALTLAEVQAKAAALSLLEEVLSAYTALAEAQGQEAVLLKKKALQERYLAVARAKRQAGNATELEVIRAEAALRQAEEDLKAALALRPARVKALEAALGKAVDEPRLAPLPEPQALGTELVALREGLEERLPALVQARQNLALAELEVRLADNDYTPRLTLEKARANLESARRALANALAQAEANLESAYAQAQAAWGQVELARENRKAAERSLENAQKAFAAGTLSQVQLLEAEVALAEADFALLQAKNAYLRALAALGVAAGVDLTGLLEVE
ncbi:TolC family protein [Thermus thermophilus]|uniref:TolC family protein n=1 Tax=Thermus thermophilus TaxID=274 RepID=UPI001C768197|nr:TolC family protein [Thermus thermophilus]BCZ89283.1 transporter [Thermus thermophilus]BCZ94461.1 transporter [Thermus thermophilus]